MVCSSACSFLMDAELIIALTLSAMLKRILLSYPGNTTHPAVPVGLFAPLQKAYGAAAEPRAGITKKQFFSITRANIKATWRSARMHPSGPNAVLHRFFENWNRRKAMEDMFGALRLVSAFLAWETPQNRHQLRQQPGAGMDILSRRGPGSDSIITPIRRLLL